MSELVFENEASRVKRSDGFARSWPALVFALLTTWLFSVSPSLAADPLNAVAWYDSLGFPDAKNLPYVRVTTGEWKQVEKDALEGDPVEGFLVREDADAFTVFLCSVPSFKDVFGFSEKAYAPLSIVRFVRRKGTSTLQPVAYEVEDFTQVASNVLVRVRAQAARSGWNLTRGYYLAPQAQVFAFARACEQKGLAETALALMKIVANISDSGTGKVDPGKLCEALQQQIGGAVLSRAEGRFGDASLSWADLIKPYEDFDIRYPASSRVGYAREAAAMLRQVIAEEAAHRPKPTGQMSPAEQAAEDIYQLRNLHNYLWTMHTHYPGVSYPPDGKKMVSPVDQLVDLGDLAIPPLIEALEDRHFTRCLEQNINTLILPSALRVSDVAQRTLEHISGGNFYAVKKDGKLVRGTTRQQAEAWWADRQHKGERQQLAEETARGGIQGCAAARILVTKYPDAAILAIEAGIRATTEESLRDEDLPADIRAANVQGLRGEYVEIAGSLPGEMPLAFLKSKLTPGNGLRAQVHAAEALFARHQPEAVPAMITAWRNVQPRLLAKAAAVAKAAAADGEGVEIDPDIWDVYSEVGGLITFLARSGDAGAIDALGQEARKAPVVVRVAVVKVFWPEPRNGGESSSGPGVDVRANNPNSPTGGVATGEAGLAVQRLLVAALDDQDKRVGLQGNYDNISYKDPRICDMAAFVLSRHWPEKYQFDWAKDPVECDAQITMIRNRWHSETGLPRNP